MTSCHICWRRPPPLGLVLPLSLGNPGSATVTDWLTFRGLYILPVPFRREVLGRDIHEGCTGPHQVAGSHVTRGRKSPWHHLRLILHTVDKPEVTDQFIIIDVFRRVVSRAFPWTKFIGGRGEPRERYGRAPPLGPIYFSNFMQFSEKKCIK